MVRKGETKAERAERSQVAATVNQLRLDISVVQKAMSVYPECAAAIRKNLQTLRIIGEGGEVLVEPSLMAEQLKKNPKAKSKAAGAGDNDGGVLFLNYTAEDVMPAEWTCLAKSPPEMLGHILESSEPSFWNQYSFVSLKPKAQKKVPIQVFYEIFEFMFEYDINKDIEPGVTIGAVVDNFVEMAASLGHRIRGMKLPLNFKAQGVYMKAVFQDKLLIASRFDCTVRDCTSKLKGWAGKLAAVVAAKNFSCASATVGLVGKMGSHTVASVLPIDFGAFAAVFSEIADAAASRAFAPPSTGTRLAIGTSLSSAEGSTQQPKGKKAIEDADDARFQLKPGKEEAIEETPIEADEHSQSPSLFADFVDDENEPPDTGGHAEAHASTAAAAGDATGPPIKKAKKAKKAAVSDDADLEEELGFMLATD